MSGISAALAAPQWLRKTRRAAKAPAELWGRLGLRARVTGLFAAGALLLSVLMGGLAYFTTSHFLLSDRLNSAVKDATLGAGALETALRAPSPNPFQILDGLDATYGATYSALVLDGSPFYSSFAITIDEVPGGLRTLVASGTPGTQTFVLHDDPQMVVGIPLRSVDASYFAIFDVKDLDHTLHILALALALGGLVTTLLGGVVGRLASARTLRPLSAVSRAAVAIAGGDLDTRLKASSEDPDLAGLTQSFNAMVDRLQERIERDARFASDVSHELRSPLTTLANTLNVLEAHAGELSDRAQRALELLGADLRRFERMVAELLEMSRSDVGSTDASLELVDAGELVRRAVTSSSSALLHLNAPPVWIDPLLDEVVLNVDKRRFERIMANLLENAANYGGGATCVSAEPGRDPSGHSTVLIAVEDSGPGVPPSERRRIFERFYRGQEAGRRGASTGTGLGLALVAEHVKVLGGRVGIEDAPGGGARFTVELPAQDGWEPG
ncbi:MAG: ATP-binding protein [Acidimicrobiales bacterium]